MTAALLTFSPSELALLVIVGAALTLIISNWLRPDLVALLVLLALSLSGLLAPDQALAGFSRPAVLTIVGLFVITAALERTGVVQWGGHSPVDPARHGRGARRTSDSAARSSGQR